MANTSPQEVDGFDRLFTPGRLALVLFLILLAYYPGILAGERVFYYRDAGLFSYPAAEYFRGSIWRGQFPLWNPYNNCGTPFMAQWNTLTLYPGSLICLLLPFPWCVNLFLMAHLFLGALGAWHLGREWFGTRWAGTVAGLAFGWNGLALSCLSWLAHNAALGWMPWVILFTARAARDGGRTVATAALLGACQMLCGSPEVTLFTWMVALANVALEACQQKAEVWPRLGRVAGMGFWITGLSAAQLLPWMDFVAHSDRSAASGGSDWGLPVWGVANFLVPLFHLTPSLSGVYMQARQEILPSYYAGILPLFLALLACWRRPGPRVTLLAVFAFLGIVLAMGNAGLVLPLARRILPVLGFSRYPVKLLVLTNFSIALLAGAGAAWLQRQTMDALRRTFALTVLALAAGIGIVLAVSFHSPAAGELWSVVLPNGIERLAILLAGVAAASALVRARHPAAGFIWLALMGLDICLHMPAPNPTVTSHVYDRFPPPGLSSVPQLGRARAMLSAGAQELMGQMVHPDPLRYYIGQRSELFGDCNLFDSIPLTGGFFGMHLRESARIAQLLANPAPPAHLIAFLGVSEIAPAQPLFSWERQTNFLPFATIGQEPLFRRDEDLPALLPASDFDPRHSAYLPPDAKAEISAHAAPSARVVSSRVTPQECVFQTSSEQPSILVIAQMYYHCWKAAIDGRAAKLERANLAFQAVEVPAGSHTVRLVYRDDWFLVGMVVSGLSWLAGLRIQFRH